MLVNALGSGAAPQLTTLDVSNGIFGTDGARALASALASVPQLTSLEVSSNSMAPTVYGLSPQPWTAYRTWRAGSGRQQHGRRRWPCTRLRLRGTNHGMKRAATGASMNSSSTILMLARHPSTAVRHFSQPRPRQRRCSYWGRNVVVMAPTPSISCGNPSDSLRVGYCRPQRNGHSRDRLCCTHIQHTVVVRRVAQHYNISATRTPTQQRAVYSPHGCAKARRPLLRRA